MANWKEFTVQVPWGEIKGKTLGKDTDTPILFVHGIQDNAGSYNLLIPHLPRGFFYVTFDLPGHGQSSHFSYGVPLSYYSYLYIIRRMVDHFNWSKCLMVGHSFGAQLSAWYTGLHPEKVIKLVVLDGLVPLLTKESETTLFLRKVFDKHDAQERALAQKQPPVMTREQALQRLLTNRPSLLSRQAAEALIERGLTPSGQGFRFSIDQRLKLFVRPVITLAMAFDVISHIQCPVLCILASESLKGEVSSVNKVLPIELYPSDVTSLLKHFENFSVHEIKGNHDLHLNQPEKVAKLISPFISNLKSAL